MYVSMDWVNIGSCNGLSPIRRQAITWTNTGTFSIGLPGTSFSEIWIGILSCFIQENVFENVVCHNGGHFVQGGGGELTILYIYFFPDYNPVNRR